MSRALISMTILMFMAMPLLAFGPSPTRASDYPANHLIQDEEPGTTDQWDLDVAQGKDGKLYAVWVDKRLNYPDIRFSRSNDGSVWGDGLTNSNDVIVNDDSGMGSDHSHPSITITDTSTLYAVWVVGPGGSGSLAMSRSTSLGNTWNRSWEVQAVNGTVSDPYIRWTPSGLYLVYVEERQHTATGNQKDIMFTMSTNGGETFETPRILNDDDSGQDQLRPRLVASGDRVAVVWEDYRNGDSSLASNPDIYMAHSSDGGDSFAMNIKIGSDEEGLNQANPDLAYSPYGDLLIVFQESTDQGWRIKHAMAWTGSPSWDGEVPLTYQTVAENLTRMDQTHPRVAYSNRAFAVSWTEVEMSVNYPGGKSSWAQVIRTGYLGRTDAYVELDHIIDDTIPRGEIARSPGFFYSQMNRYTSQVLGYTKDSVRRTQVFWIDFRTDPNPENGINEDPDPYTATAHPREGTPPGPQVPILRVGAVSWDSIEVEWGPSPEVEFKGYYLSYARGRSPPNPDPNQNNGSINDRMRTKLTFGDLRPDSEYQFRLMVMDQLFQKAYSPILTVRTGVNVPPTFRFIEPDGFGDVSDSSFMLKWEAFDPEEVARYDLYFDTDQDPDGQEWLTGGFEAADGYGEYLWNTSGLPPGGYTINATISDGINTPRTIYSYSIIVNHPSPVVDRPTVTSVQIEGGKDTAYVDCQVTVRFSEIISPASVDGGSFYILDPSRQKVQGSIALGNSEVSWKPSSHLAFNTTYDLVVTGAVTDLEGNGLDGLGIGTLSSYSLRIRTRSDIRVPEVRSFSPQGSQAVLRPEIEVVFDIPMNGGSFGPGTVLLTTLASEEVPITMEYSQVDLTLRVRTVGPLLEGVDYQVELGSGIESAKGIHLQGGFSWSFRTGAPNLLKDTDQDGVPDDLDWFMDDPSEQYDNDRDGIGDNSDMDDDDDGMSDQFETRYGLDPLDPSDADLDPDGDGASNLEEFRNGTDPLEDDGGESGILLWALLFGAILLISAVLVMMGVTRSVQRKKEQEMRSFFREE